MPVYKESVYTETVIWYWQTRAGVIVAQPMLHEHQHDRRHPEKSKSKSYFWKKNKTKNTCAQILQVVRNVFISSLIIVLLLEQQVIMFAMYIKQYLCDCNANFKLNVRRRSAVVLCSCSLDWFSSVGTETGASFQRTQSHSVTVLPK